MGDRTPLHNSQKGNLPMDIMKTESPKTPPTDEEDKENPPTRSDRPRESLLRLFDPLYSPSPVKHNPDADNSSDTCADTNATITIEDANLSLGFNDTVTFEADDCELDITLAEDKIDTTITLEAQDANLSLGINDTVILRADDSTVIPEEVTPLPFLHLSLEEDKIEPQDDEPELIGVNEKEVDEDTASVSPALELASQALTVTPLRVSATQAVFSSKKLGNCMLALSYNIARNLLENAIGSCELHKGASGECEFVSVVNIGPAASPVQEQSTKETSSSDEFFSSDAFAFSALDTLDSSITGIITENKVYPINKKTVKLYQLCQEAMADLNDKLALQEQEVCDLKLQLNQSQQARASLELAIRQKEEIVIKTQAEAQRKEAASRQEIRQLLEKLETKKDVFNQDAVISELKETNEKLKLREEKLMNQLKAQTNKENTYTNVMKEYESTMALQLAELDKTTKEYDTAKLHLANLEIAFSDVHQKYERSKTIVEGYKNNEDTLRQNLLHSGELNHKTEEKYDSLKAHAKAQIDKSNRELIQSNDKHHMDLTKLNAIIKRMEIKIDSLTNALEQKTKECEGLAELCDEVTGKVR